VRPLDHGRIEVCPEVVVGVYERGDLGVVDGDSGIGRDLLPVLFAGVGTAVIGVAMSPVGGTEAVFVDAVDSLHLLPG
jgi:hypothetical protein